ncbi:uroporphyrinogen-III C-methyltransferase [Salipaludibacillus sp. LMS25]|uniref:uroporphyrinogen-III C-methyltransferase n=1 Tax=Salipaludibacillus sp. LMS25 TaxID=2924031 RepID=UPI0020CFF7AB|nr:uroporphyrinogen-III C-methyltransferase [Salipaludibacillus sp. LMS25]UTR14996.1 uroporphyrinogen-III C-methyltransferase [Salipaludibacillus sp. LMS25]
MGGFVSFVGAGPGDIGLLTEKGRQCLEKAEVVLYDRLANPRLLRYTKANCQLIYCGKLPDRHVMRQEKINDTLIEMALAGKRVVRLKGGDPSVFGRVGEEAEAARNEGIDYEIVPGVTSSIAAASYAGMPVTHRDYSASFTLRTGHSCQENELKTHSDDELGDTIAYYMGVKNLHHHCQVLINKGFPPETKVAVIEWATTGKQRTVEGTLLTISDEVKAYNIQNPAMTIIGDVVALRQKLAWYEQKRMFGKRLLIAKASAEESKLERYFLNEGGEAYAFPTLKTEKKSISSHELKQIRLAEKLVFLSPESVTILIESLLAHGYDIRDLPRQIYSLSEKTKKALLSMGIRSEKITEPSHEMIKVGYVNKPMSAEDNSTLITTHHLQIDDRFEVIDKRLLNEETWETVVFPSQSSVDWFLAALKSYGYRDNWIKTRSFAYIGQRVKAYAEEKGFTKIDEEVQYELALGYWK